MSKILTRLGRLVRVTNQRTKSFSHENDSYISVWVRDGEEVKCLLFTDSEISKALHRAQKNQEDLTERSWISKLID